MNKAFNKVIKSHVLLAVLTVVAAVLLTTGVTYSVFQIQNKNAENQSIAVGTMDTDITSITGAMILDGLYPEKASSITDETKKYEFSLVNNGTFDLKYKIYLKDSTNELLNQESKYRSYKKLSSMHYKYINYKLDGNTVPNNLESVSENDKFVIIEGVLKAGAKEDHYLQFFLDSGDTTSTGAPNDISGSVLSLDIYMDAYVSDTVVDNIIASVKQGKPGVNDSGLYATKDDYGTSYYYRGDVKDNYVKFADQYFRIIRINGDGTMRLMYDGTLAHPNGEASDDRAVKTDAMFNEVDDDAKYAGYMYGTNSDSKLSAQTNTVNSSIKTALDNWFKTTILDKGLGNNVVDRIFCNDRTTASSVDTWATSDTTLGYGQNTTVYGASNRLLSREDEFLDSHEATLVCPSNNDSFTTNSSRGNGSLTYPVGLMSADEMALMKLGNLKDEDKTSYLYKGIFYFSMTPSNFYGSSTNIFGLDENGSMYKTYADSKGGLVPVINLSSEYSSMMLGTGTMDDPYRVE